MKMTVLAGMLLCLLCVTAAAQDTLLELAEKLDNADRTAAVKMFPELEKRNLIGVSSECQLVDGKPRDVIKFFFHLAISQKTKDSYSFHVLKNGNPAARALAAQNLRSRPELISEALQELLSEKNMESFDLAAATVLKLTSSSWAARRRLFWKADGKHVYLKLNDNLKTLVMTSPAAWQDERFDATKSARRQLALVIYFCKPYSGISEGMIEALTTRIEYEKNPAIKSGFKLALAFANNDIDPLIAVLINNKAGISSRQTALKYLGWMGAQQAEMALLTVLGKIAPVKELHEQLFETFEELTERYKHVGTEKVLKIAFGLYEHIGEKALKYARRILLENYSPEIDEGIREKAREQKDEKQKQVYLHLAAQLAKKHADYNKRKELLEKHNNNSLLFLYGHQGKDGGWDSDGFMRNCNPELGKPCTGKGDADWDINVTALSLLTYLGSGHTHRVGQFKKIVKQALDRLVLYQTEHGIFGDIEDRLDITKQAMATMALCEAYAVTRDHKIEKPARKAIEFVLSEQRDDGGWNKDNKLGSSRILTTAWAVLSMKAAKMACLDVPEDCFRKALSFLDTLDCELPGEKDRAKRIEKLEEIAAAAISAIFCGRSRKDTRSVKLFRILNDNLPSPDKGQGPVYLFFGTYATFQYGGANWKNWHGALIDLLLKTQLSKSCAHGSWNPIGPREKILGRIGTTALNTLTLEIYYRYARAGLFDDDDW